MDRKLVSEGDMDAKLRQLKMYVDAVLAELLGIHD